MTDLLLPPDVLARYPFLPQAKSSLESVGTQAVGADQLRLAQERVLDALKGNLLTPSASIVSYALARMLLHLMGSDYYSNLFARSEVDFALTALRSEPAPIRTMIAQSTFPSLSNGNGPFAYSISLTEFLQSGGKLADAQLEEGRVMLSTEGLYAVLKKAWNKRIRAPLSLPKEAVPKLFADYAEELRLRLPPLPKAETYSGKYLSLPCVARSIAGTPEGKRYYASLSIAIACQLDGLSRQKAEEVMQAFVNNSRSGTHEFTLKEALATLEWVYRRSMRFSCKMQRAHGLAPADICGPPCPLDIARAKARAGPPIPLTRV